LAYGGDSMSAVALNYRNPEAVKKAGMTALRSELGSVGAIYAPPREYSRLYRRGDESRGFDMNIVPC
jgi:hypothetical protein